MSSRFYQEFVKPQGTFETIGFSVLRTEQRMGWLAAIVSRVSPVMETLKCAS